mmetsp:Transcript_43782/g.44463  ORF Transcript_43782/g.44463 Transcript_43782/m.44463 type:complete len:109 (-) Transcript_43782:483-809(-)
MDGSSELTSTNNTICNVPPGSCCHSGCGAVRTVRPFSYCTNEMNGTVRQCQFGKQAPFYFTTRRGKRTKAKELCSPARERGWYGTDDNHRFMSPTLLERPSSYSRRFY